MAHIFVFSLIPRGAVYLKMIVTSKAHKLFRCILLRFKEGDMGIS